MKLLPHYFKWIGLGLFFLAMIFGIDDMQRGYLEASNTDSMEDFKRLLPDVFSIISDYIILLGLLLYILSKNKIEDEFAQKMRYESAFSVLVLTILTVLIIYIFNPEFEINPSIFLTLQMVAYLLFRSIKRGIIVGDGYEEQS